MNILDALYSDERVVLTEGSFEGMRDELNSLGVEINEKLSNDDRLFIFIEGDRWKTLKKCEEGIVLSRKRHS